MNTQNLSELSDKMLIALYRYNNNQQAFAELNNRHEEVLSVYSLKLFQEFHDYEGSMEVEDYKEELRLKMLVSIQEKINLTNIDENYEPKRMFFKLYYSLRHSYASIMKQRQKYKYYEVSYDDLDFDDNTPIMEKLQSIRKQKDFTQQICDEDEQQHFMGILTPMELSIFSKIKLNYNDSEIEKILHVSHMQMQKTKRSIAQKIKQVRG